MKFCSHCGNEILDEAVICPNCGCRTNYTAETTSNTPSSRNKILGTIAKILMLIQTVGQGIAAIGLIIVSVVVSLGGEIVNGVIENAAASNPEMIAPDGSAPNTEILFGIATAYLIILAVAYFISLAWCIPMTISTWRKLQRRENIGVGFKVCTLLFVNLIAGVLLLCMEEEQTQSYQQTSLRL